MPKRFTSTEILKQHDETYLNGFSVDCVVFGFNEATLKVLLCRLLSNNQWMLPGNFVQKDEDVDEAARRVLVERTGLENIFMRQFFLFGTTGRIDLEKNKKTLENPDKDQWYMQRLVSMGYFSLVRFNDTVIQEDPEIEEAKWFNISELPELYADHSAIIQKAVETLRTQVGYISFGKELLPEKFTMPELRTVYETIIGRELDRRNFQRKVLSIGVITRLEEKRKNGAHKAPFLYMFDPVKYKEGVRNMLSIISYDS